MAVWLLKLINIMTHTHARARLFLFVKETQSNLRCSFRARGQARSPNAEIPQIPTKARHFISAFPKRESPPPWFRMFALILQNRPRNFPRARSPSSSRIREEHTRTFFRFSYLRDSSGLFVFNNSPLPRLKAPRPGKIF